MAAVGATVPLHEQRYSNLATLQDVGTPCGAPRLVPKQLHPGWVAKKSLKPALSDLWLPDQQSVRVLDTRPVVHHKTFCRRALAQAAVQLL